MAPGHGVSLVAIEGSSGGPCSKQVDHRVDVDVAGDQVGHQIELSIPARADIDVVGDDEPTSVRCRGDVGEPLAPHVVVVEQPVPVRAVDGAAANSHPEPVVLGRRLTCP